MFLRLYDENHDFFQAKQAISHLFFVPLRISTTTNNLNTSVEQT